MPAASKATSTCLAVPRVAGGDRDLGARPLGGGTAVLERVDGEHDARAGRDAHLRQQQADRTAADDRHARADADVTEVDRVDGDPERLEQRPGDAVQRLGQRVQPAGRPAQVLLQAAVPAPVTGEPHVGAEVRMALAAQIAVLARDRRVDGDAAAGQRAGLDNARELVPDHQRGVQARVSDRALVEPVQVGSADADGLDAHERLARPRLGLRLVGHAQVADAVEARDAHQRPRVRVKDAPSRETCSSPSWISARRPAASLSSPPTM